MKQVVLLALVAVAMAVMSDRPSSAGDRSSAAAAAAVEPRELRDAAAKALAVVQRSQTGWYKVETCTSCHQQLVPAIPLRLASERGVPFDRAAASAGTAAAFAYLTNLDAAVQNYDYIDVSYTGWTLVAAHAAGIPPSLSTSAYAQHVAARQEDDGGWITTDARPPQMASRFSATAICARAIRLYLPASLAAERDGRLVRARTWLQTNVPRTTEDRAFRLLGLAWTDGSDALRSAALKELVAQQREDGGWSQLPSRPSDAYATGEVLMALHEAGGMATTDPVYVRGLRFLLRTQAADGSWHVVSRLNPPAPVSPPYFETGFPYGHDQFVSSMGTSWAADALMLALPSDAGSTAEAPASPAVAPTEGAGWVETALDGTAADLRRLLDGGLDPNAKTSTGMTVLMIAARDADKVRMLVERGADVNARSDDGFTPLMVAASYRGSSQSVRALLKNGAKAVASPDVKIHNDASAFFLAVMAGDVASVDALLAAGSSLTAQMLVLGRFKSDPFVFGSFGGDPRLVERLLAAGANVDQVDGEGITALGWATLMNNAELVGVLARHRADVNHVDKRGMTPLLYAASVDYGDTSVVETLLACGASPKAKTKEGRTALELAKGYGYMAAANALTAPTAKVGR